MDADLQPWWRRLLSGLVSSGSSGSDNEFNGPQRAGAVMGQTVRAVNGTIDLLTTTNTTVRGNLLIGGTLLRDDAAQPLRVYTLPNAMPTLNSALLTSDTLGRWAWSSELTPASVDANVVRANTLSAADLEVTNALMAADTYVDALTVSTNARTYGNCIVDHSVVAQRLEIAQEAAIDGFVTMSNGFSVTNTSASSLLNGNVFIDHLAIVCRRSPTSWAPRR